MRLVVCTLSAVLLSGCSWLGGAFGGGQHGQSAQSAQSSTRYYAGDKRRGHHQKARSHDPCQIFSPQQPIPQGCDPSQVTLGTAGGFPQQPHFGGGQYASQGYGSHASVAGQQAAHYQPQKEIRKPRLRASLSLGLEKSNSGSLLDYAKVPTIDPVAGYNPQDFLQDTDTGSAATGNITTTTWTANTDPANLDPLLGIFAPNTYEAANAPSISFDDVHSTPARVAAGAEYIFSPRTTLFANAGYSHAEGNSGQVATIDASVYERVSSQDFIDDPANPGIPIPAPGGPVTNTTFIPNQQIARFSYDFTDMERIDLEAGARHYFNPIVKSQGYKTITPFVGASVGASHYNAVSFDVSQEQAYYSDFFDGTAEPGFYSVTGPSTRVDLYDSQWVPSGQLNAGMEWQVTPKTALAFETGVRIEGARDYSNGAKGDKNIAIPMTIRGSYNF